MRKQYLLILIVVGFLISSTVSVSAEPQKIDYNNKNYYPVNGNDKAMDTGNEVCAAVGKTCVGYTALTLDVCTKAHPKAVKKTDANGSKAGFYCDGAPQGGTCANEKDTCHICPTCNTNMDCSTEIGTLYREAYIECSGASDTIQAPGRLAKMFGWSANWWGKFRSSVVRSFDEYRKKLGVLMRQKTVKKVTIKVQGPDGLMEDADIPEDSYVCEFYQQNKKLVTCGAIAAADNFCITAMNSRYAKAELCQEDGLIICSNPCTTSPQQIKPKTCAFDNDRARGKQAPPLDFCNETKTIKVDMGDLGKKAPGQECKHGGECTTGYCLGQTSDSGIKYFCSCSQSKLDYTCGAR